METDNDIERQIKELERDKRLEEIKQLRADAKTRWITPTVLVALLPLLGGFGLWIVGELKQYNDAFKALAERDALRQEKAALQSEKVSLNIEIGTLLGLKRHYADEAQRLERETAAKQHVINTTYLRGVFEMGEAQYALGLGGEPLDENALEQLKADAKQLPAQSGHTLEEVLARYDFISEVLIRTTREIISEFENTLKLVPASDWTRALRYKGPGGGGVSTRKILVLDENPQRYYDVVKGGYLTKEEIESAR
jgi:hypothetical protein